MITLEAGRVSLSLSPPLPRASSATDVSGQMLAVESFGQARFSKIPFYRLADDKRSVRLTHGGFSDGGPSISLSRHRGCLPTRVFFVFFSTVISSQFLRLPRRARLRSLSPGFDASPLQKHLGRYLVGLKSNQSGIAALQRLKGFIPPLSFLPPVAGQTFPHGARQRLSKRLPLAFRLGHLRPGLLRQAEATPPPRHPPPPGHAALLVQVSVNI